MIKCDIQKWNFEICHVWWCLLRRCRVDRLNVSTSSTIYTRHQHEQADKIALRFEAKRQNTTHGKVEMSVEKKLTFNSWIFSRIASSVSRRSPLSIVNAIASIDCFWMMISSWSRRATAAFSLQFNRLFQLAISSRKGGTKRTKIFIIFSCLQRKNEFTDECKR